MPPLIKQAMTAESAQEKKAEERVKGGAEKYGGGGAKWRKMLGSAKERRRADEYHSFKNLAANGS